MAFKKTRNMKVYGMSGYRYRSTPTIQLKGEWLKEIGFDIGDYISITCENGRLVITPDAEAERKRLHEQFVAECKAEYAVVAEPGLEV